MLHLFRWDPDVVAVPAVPRLAREKLRLGAWVCALCRVRLDFAVRYDLDHGNDCPGQVAAASGSL